MTSYVCEMAVDPLEVTQTWPMAMSRPHATFTQQKIKATSSRRLFDALQNARDYIDQTAEMNDLHTQHTRTLIQNLCEELEKRKASTQRRKSRQSVQTLGVIREGVSMDGRLRDEPHFESMIFTDIDRRLSMHRNSINEAGEDAAADENEEIDLGSVYEGLDPWFIRAIPHFLMIIVTIVYLIVGTVILRKIDDQLAEKPFYRVILFAYSMVATIGWGDLGAKNPWSQAFCVLYAMVGIPITYSTLANVGKVLSELYTVDWIYLVAVVRGKKPKAHAKQLSDRMSIKSCLNLIFIHFFIGLILFSGVIQQLSVIESTYLIAISTSTIGLGDYLPTPNNLFDTTVIIIYLTFGIIIVSAFFLNISYYFQLFFYVYLNEWIHDKYEWMRGRKNKISDVFDAQTKPV
ncbi:hypothetical protein M3Y97_01123400 [Aphelenchoides bicaudatus]|nr:hypothetical protein M3Y97_01123400 [Aphelenchoides bicaudatus]